MTPAEDRIQWRRGWRALRRLIADPERTEQVFELIQAMSGRSRERAFRRFGRQPEGRALLAERPSLLEVLCDRERLRKLPEGSLGRAYLEFMEQDKLSAGALLEASQKINAQGQRVVDPDQRWFSERLRDAHDLWHVLTGYGRDNAGEAAVLAFSYAQTRTRGIGLIVLVAAWRGPKDWSCHWQRYLLRAGWRGLRARPLSSARWEDLLGQPLAEVRRRLRIEDPEVAHPGGVIVSTPEAA